MRTPQSAALLREQFQVAAMIGGRKEHRLTVVATLGNVVGNAGKDCSGGGEAYNKVPTAAGLSHENASVPFL
jgi:hypothetical protein